MRTQQMPDLTLRKVPAITAKDQTYPGKYRRITATFVIPGLTGIQLIHMTNMLSTVDTSFFCRVE